MNRLSKTAWTVMLCIIPAMAMGQKFHFGGSAGAVISQVDGDNLRGFNKIGYQVGLLGGYSLDDHNWIAVELRHVAFGSRKKGEQASVPLEIDLQSIDVLIAYTRRFGDRWDGQQRFRFLVGPRLHRIIEVESDLIRRNEIKTFFISGQFGVSHLLTGSVLIDLTYTHGMTDILDSDISGVGKLQPYYLSVGVSYYLSY